MQKISLEEAQELLNKGETPTKEAEQEKPKTIFYKKEDAIETNKSKIDVSQWILTFVESDYIVKLDESIESGVKKVFKINSPIDERVKYTKDITEFIIRDEIYNTELIDFISKGKRLVELERHTVTYDEDNGYSKTINKFYNNLTISVRETSSTGINAVLEYSISGKEINNTDKTNVSITGGIEGKELCKVKIKKCNNLNDFISQLNKTMKKPMGDAVEEISNTYGGLSNEGKSKLCETLAGEKKTNVIEKLKIETQLGEVLKTCVICSESTQVKPNPKISRNNQLLHCKFDKVKTLEVCPKCGCNVFSVEADVIVDITP